MAYCYVFIDESGNYHFSPSGTKHWVITSLITEDIRSGVLELYDLKHRLIDLGTDIEYFHASEDRQSVRNEVFNIIKSLTSIRCDSLVVEKSKTSPALRPMSRFYPVMAEQLLRFPFDPRGVDIRSYDKVFIFFDRAPSHKKHQIALIAGVKQYLSRHMTDVPFEIVMHSSASHPYLQIVDYLSWAIYVKWERNEIRPYDEINHLIYSDFPIFQDDAVTWY